METKDKSGKKLTEPSASIAKTKEKLERQSHFLKLGGLTSQEKQEALKSINGWISLQHSYREDLGSESMGLFKNNQETASPSKAVQQMHKTLQNKLEKEAKNS